MDITMDMEKAKADTDTYLAGKRSGNPNDGNESAARVMLDATGPKATWTEFWLHFKQWRHGKILLGTGSWFFIDIAFWGLGLNNPNVLKAIGYASS